MKNIPDSIHYVLVKPISLVVNNVTNDMLDEIELFAPNGKVLNLTLKLRDLIQEAQMDKTTKYMQVLSGGGDFQKQIDSARQTPVVEIKTDYSKVDFCNREEAYSTCEKAFKDMMDSGISLEKYSEIFKRLLAQGFGKIGGKSIVDEMLNKMSDYDFMNIMGLYYYCFLD